MTYYSVLGQFIYSAFLAGSLTLGLTIIYLNHRQRYLAARLLLFTIGWGNVMLGFFMLGHGAGIHLYLLSVISLVAALFERRELLFIYLVVGLSVLLVVYLEFSGVTIAPVVQLPAEALRRIYASSFIGTIAVSLILLYILQTNARAYEAQISRQQEFYQSVLDNLPIDLAVYDAQRRFMLVNQQGLPHAKARQLALGKTETEFRQRINRNLPRGESRLAKLEEVFSRKTAVAFDEQDGGPAGQRHFLSQLAPIFGPDGNVQFVVGVRTEITEVKLKDEQIRRSEAMLNTMFEATADAMVLLDVVSGQIINCNSAAVRLFAYQNKQELLGRDAQELQTSRFGPEQVREVVRTVKENGFWESDVEYFKADGTTFWGHVVLSVGQMNGQWVNVARVTDITLARQQAETVRRSEAMLKAVFEISNDALCVVNPVTNVIIDCNPATLRALGYDNKRDLVGRKGIDFQKTAFT
ncbi:MAG: PAS domain S-box protein, partial [Bernardetiaceae bacterium]|nr:PAS domain S-box protein [Bernardetiaceae bacterium]